MKKKCTIVWLALVEAFVQLIRFLFSPNRKSPYTGRFMTPLEQIHLLHKYNKGIVINGDLRLDLDRSYRHLLLTGVTGAGKSTVVYLPFILQTDLPMIIMDVSGSLYDNSAGYLKSQGYQVLRLNFSDPFNSEGYNIMHRAKGFSALKRISKTLVETALGKGEGNAVFWNLSAEQILFCLMAALKESPSEKHHNLANIRHLLNNLTSKKDCPTFLWMMENASNEVYEEFKGAMFTNEKVVDSVLATLRAALQSVADPALARMTATDTLGDLQELRRGRSVLYLSVKETEISYVNYLIAVALSEILDMCMNMPTELDRPLAICLDELGHFKIPEFSSYLTTLRKRNVMCIISVQSKSMLANKYGRADAESIITGGCASHMILPGQMNPQENESLSRLLGSHMIRHKGRDMVVPILSPDEIYSLTGQGIFLHPGHRPAKLKLHPFYKDKKLLMRSKIPAPSYNQKELPKVELIQLPVKKEQPPVV